METPDAAVFDRSALPHSIAAARIGVAFCLDFSVYGCERETPRKGLRRAEHCPTMASELPW